MASTLLAEEVELLGDSKYRAYISQVEKALKSFEYTSEWADLISALGKLNKVLLSHIKFPVIPKRVTIGKRLAQCLHPALPGGVHLKALETYDIIFKCIGTQRLALDLFTYSAGLFPLLGYAAMNVKPPLLSLYENHFVPLGILIKPGLTGLLLGLLPGLEEGSEYFERTDALLTKFVEAADPIFFYGCLWECVLTSPSVRLSAINFVLSHYNKRQTMEDQLYVIGSDIDLMVQALCSAVEDTSVLVQRSLLDLLLYGFPMHNSQLTKPDMSKIVCAAIRVVSRRDMSLNRRLYAWLLGTDSSGAPVNVKGVVTSSDGGKSHRRDSVGSNEADLDYFNTYSREFLVYAVHKLINEDFDSESTEGKPGYLKPFRILISLLDKPEVAAAILEEVLIDVFRRFYRECSSMEATSRTNNVNGANLYQTGAISSKSRSNRRFQDLKAKDNTTKSTTELIKTANLLFGTFEPYYMWDFIGRTFETSCSNTAQKNRKFSRQMSSHASSSITVRELCELVDFLLDKVSLETYLETQTEHLPELLRQMTTSLTSHCQTLDESELTASLKLCSKILSRVLPSMVMAGTENTDAADEPKSSPVSRNTSTVKKIIKDEKNLTAKDTKNNNNNKNEEISNREVKKENEFNENGGGENISVNSKDFSSNDVDNVEVGTEHVSEVIPLNNPSKDFGQNDRVNHSENESPKNEQNTQESESENYASAESDIQNNDVFSDIQNNDVFEEDSGFLNHKDVDTENDTFCEFVAFQDNDSNSVSTPKPLTLMQACVQGFHKLFCQIVTTKLIPDSNIPKQCMRQLLDRIACRNDNTEHVYDITPDLANEEVAKNGNGEDPVTQMLNDSGSTLAQDEEFLVRLEPQTQSIVEAFKCACQLLVDFSSFPMYCTDYHKILDMSFNEDDRFHFPDWLELLLTCACFVDHFETHTAAVSTMLDLISLTKSIISESECKGQSEGQEDWYQPRRSTSEGTVSVVIVPSISPKHLKFLNEKTQFYQLIGERLWHNLGPETPMFHQRSVELFYQLHQLSHSPWVCEDVIGQELVSINQKKRIEAHSKYAVLWHLTREIRQNAAPGAVLRTFDRSMCVMLDSLINDTSPTRALTQTWLTHSIQRGDIARILEPILLMLLHPDTARISIQHVSIHQPKKVRLSDSTDESGTVVEAKIFAISSEGGNVIYHVSNQNGKPFSKKTSEELRTVALTTITESGSATRITPTKGETEMHFEKVNPHDLNLRMNPFGSANSLDKVIFDGFDPPSSSQFPDVSNMRRLDSKTCKKEGIFFDDNEEEKDNGEGVAETESAADIVRSILDSIIDAATRESSANSETSSVFGDNKTVLDSNLEGNNVGMGSSGRNTRQNSLQSRESSMGPEDLLNAIDSKVSEIDSQSDTDNELGGSAPGGRKEEIPGIHPLHTHILLYTQKFDAHRTLYSLTMLKAILCTCPRLVICAMATTNITDARSPNLHQLQALLARHRKSVFGKNFFTELTSEAMASYRTCMYIEVLISTCLYFVRSYYPNLMMSKLSEIELNGNKEVQILSTEILTLLLSELINVARDSNKGFSTYLKDLLARCKVQKAILHCVLASVYNARRKGYSLRNNANSSDNLTDGIINFNEENMDANTNETFQIRLLKLVLVIIILEDQIKGGHRGDESVTLDWERLRVNFQPELSFIRYQAGKPIVYQGMFLSAILSALKQQHLGHMHRHWIAMVTSALPFMGKALGHTTVSVVNQVCRNLELLSNQYQRGTSTTNMNQPDRIPADHLLTILEGLSTMCHYSLLDSSQQVSLGVPLPPSIAEINSMINDTSSAGQILSNLIHVFNPINSREPSPAKDGSGSMQPIMEARRSVLSILPRIIASLTILWKALQVSEESKDEAVKRLPAWTMGSPKSVRHYILEFLSPVSLHHGVNLLGAVAVVWNDRRQRGVPSNKRVIPPSCEDQLLLVDLVSAIRVLPTDTLIQTITKVIKQPPPTNLDRHRKRTPLEVNMLQFFYAYIERTSVSQLVDSWPSLLALLRDGLQLSLPPPGQFLLLGILNEFVQKMPMFEERRDQRDLQDVAQKLLEATSTIAGASLEQTTWLRRNLAVKPGRQVDITEQEEPESSTDLESDDVLPVPPPVEPVPLSSEHNYRQYSVQALVMLADLIAPLLDVIYSSEEKDRVVPFLASIMHNVFPYLKNHSTHNLPSFRACSQIVSSLSGYQYTRKTWKRDVFELMMDASFFQMDSSCIEFWRIIVDNLMTHDKVTFKDLITRVTVTPSGSLNLFSSRDQEFELRAQHLKRLTFTLFSSDQDQYHRFMPDIQERLSDSLRFPNVPSIQAQVFLFFRVLIIRMSPHHVTSLWPTVITELVQVLLQIEQEIAPELDENRAQLARLANLDATWALGNGLNAHQAGGWLQLYLAACKLLDLALALPAESLPQFQLYKWAFVGDDGSDLSRRQRRENPSFIPHVLRIAKQMNKKFEGEAPVLPQMSGCPLLTVSSIRSIQDLQGFFNTLAVSTQSGDAFSNSLNKSATRKKLTRSASLLSTRSTIPKSRSNPEFRDSPVNGNLGNKYLQDDMSPRQYIEYLIEQDFLESLPRS